MPRVVVDLQAAQSRSHSERGIARYTIDLALAVERLRPDLVTNYVINPHHTVHMSLEPLIRTHKVCRTDDLRLVEQGPADVFHVTSPFEPIPLAQILPRSIVGPETRVVVTAYDVIPLVYSDVYLTAPGVRRDYQARLGLFRAADHVLAISQATADDLVRHVGVGMNRVTPVFGDASDRFQPADVPHDVLSAQLRREVPGIEDGFVLVPSGIEWRKNIGRLLEAYAALPAERRAAHQLVIQCRVLPEERAALERELAELGISERVLLTGFVEDDILVRLYQGAELVVFPSLYEGLGLPVLEARRCGAPVICGDNSSLREIVPDERARFDSTSVESIGSVLDRALADEVLRRSLVDIEVPPSFNWDSAGRATSAVLERLGRRRERPRRPRVGIISPAPPQASGPATYLGRLIGPLADRWDVTLFTIEPPETVDVDRRVRVEPLSLLDHIERLDRPFDELVYFVGNSEHHLFQPTFLARQPGVVVLHDARLTGLYGQIQALRPDLLPTGLDGALATMYPGRYPEAVGGAGYIPADEAVRLGILMVGDVAAAATRLLAHSSHAADMVELDCGHRPEVLFELPFPEVGPERDPNLVEGDLVVSFGVVGPPKDPELLIDAVSQVPGVRLVFVGPVDDGYRTELEEFAAGVGVADRFAMTGHTDDDEYESWLQRAGVAVQLRRWSNGESSAAVNDVLAAGVPTIVSDQGSFSSLPDDIVLKLPRDSSPADLAERIAFLLADADARDRLVRRARAHAGERGYPAAASALHAALFGPPA